MTPASRRDIWIFSAPKYQETPDTEKERLDFTKATGPIKKINKQGLAPQASFPGWYQRKISFIVNGHPSTCLRARGSSTMEA